MDKNIIETPGYGSVHEYTAADGYLLRHKDGREQKSVRTAHIEDWEAVRESEREREREGSRQVFMAQAVDATGVTETAAGKPATATTIKGAATGKDRPKRPRKNKKEKS